MQRILMHIQILQLQTVRWNQKIVSKNHQVDLFLQNQQTWLNLDSIKYHVIIIKFIHLGENIPIVVQAVEMVPKQEIEPVLAESVHVQQTKISFKQKFAMK